MAKRNATPTEVAPVPPTPLALLAPLKDDLDVNNPANLEMHELCLLFPQASDEDYDSLVGSMKTHGFMHDQAIILYYEPTSVVDPEQRSGVQDCRNSVPEYMLAVWAKGPDSQFLLVHCRRCRVATPS